MLHVRNGCFSMHINNTHNIFNVHNKKPENCFTWFTLCRFCCTLRSLQTSFWPSASYTFTYSIQVVKHLTLSLIFGSQRKSVLLSTVSNEKKTTNFVQLKHASMQTYRNVYIQRYVYIDLSTSFEVCVCMLFWKRIRRRRRWKKGFLLSEWSASFSIFRG